MYVSMWKGSATTFRIPGTAGTDVRLASLFNVSGSGRIVLIREFNCQQDYITNSGTTRNIASATLTAAPTGGNLHTPVAFDTNKTHVASVEFRGAASADGTGSAITATAVDRAWGMPHMRLAGIDSQVLMTELDALPNSMGTLITTDARVLLEGQGIVVSQISAGSTSAHFVLKAVWEEIVIFPDVNVAPMVTG